MRKNRIAIEVLQKSACAKLNPHLFEKQKRSKRPKYNNEKVGWDGEIFDSKKEYKEYRLLLIRQKAGEIGQLKRQVKFLLIEGNETERKCEYVADFTWIESTGEFVVADVKSEATRKLSTYIIKRKLMLSVHNIQIKEL